MGRFFIHVYHSRNDVLPAHPVNEEVRRPLEVGRYLLWGLALEKLRAGGNQRVHKPSAVLAGAASGLLDAALNEMVVAAIRLDDVEIVLAPAGVNVRVAGVLLLFPSWWASSGPAGWPLCFSNRKIACCAIELLSPFHSFPAGFPAENISDRIGME